MTFARTLLASLVLATAFAAPAHADSFASSASSAGSASSGSISTSLNGSSNSSTKNDKIANGAYRIDGIERLAQAGDKPAMVRLALHAEQVDSKLTLDLPVAVFDQQNLGRGDLVDVQKRDYGFQFAHADTRRAFFLVLADDWHDELAARPVTL